MIPRDWQQKCRATVVPYLLSPAAISEPGAISAVTGSGKTATLMLLLRDIRSAGRLPATTVVCTSRTALVADLSLALFAGLDPAARAFTAADIHGGRAAKAIEASAVIGRYDGHKKRRGRVVVTTYASLPDCLEWLGGCEFLVCDEAHRSAGELANAAICSIPWRFGMSGTLFLTDEERRLSAFSKVLYRYTAADARRDGVIVPVEVVDHGGEAVESDGLDRDRSMAALLSMLGARGGAAIGPGLIVAPSLDVGAWVADQLGRHGYRAQAVSGSDRPAVRRQVLSDIDGGALDVVVSVDLWGEGVDCPGLRWLGLLDDRRRQELVQFVGRGVRSLNVERHAHLIARHGVKEKCLLFDPAGVMRIHGLDAEDALGEAPPKERRKSVATVAREAVELVTDDRTPYAARVTALERWSLGLLRAVETSPGLVREAREVVRPMLGARLCEASPAQWKELRQLMPVARWITGPKGEEGQRVGEMHREALRALSEGGVAPAGVVADLCLALRLVGYHSRTVGQRLRGSWERGRQYVRVPTDLALPAVGPDSKKD